MSYALGQAADSALKEQTAFAEQTSLTEFSDGSIEVSSPKVVVSAQYRGQFSVYTQQGTNPPYIVVSRADAQVRGVPILADPWAAYQAGQKLPAPMAAQVKASGVPIPQAGKRWIPWALVGGGLAVALGLVLMVSSKSMKPNRRRRRIRRNMKTFYGAGDIPSALKKWASYSPDLSVEHTKGEHRLDWKLFDGGKLVGKVSARMIYPLDTGGPARDPYWTVSVDGEGEYALKAAIRRRRPRLSKNSSRGGRKKRAFTIRSVEHVREGTYKVYIDLGRDGEIRVIVYPSPLPMQVLSDGPVQWLESDLSEAQRKKIMSAVAAAKRSR